jgi:ABC-type Fe3+/spermidine/putrescine transport system ATPase subunit
LDEAILIDTNTGISGKITCAVRPERIRVSGVETAGFDGVITNRHYFGSNIRYEIKTIDGSSQHAITAQVPVASNLFNTGDAIHFSIDYADIRIFPG